MQIKIHNTAYADGMVPPARLRRLLKNVMQSLSTEAKGRYQDKILGMLQRRCDENITDKNRLTCV